jgi:hypothetical protein
MPNTFLDELAKINSQNFLGGLTKMGESIKGIRQNEAVNDLYNEFRIKNQGVKSTDEQLSGLNEEMLKSIDFSKPDAIERFGEKTANATAYMNKILNMSESYSNMYQPFITAFATLGDEGVTIANSLSRELEGKQQLLEQKSKIPLMQVQQEMEKIQYGRTIQEYRMNEEEYEQYKKQLRINSDVQQLEGIIRSLPEYNNMPDQTQVHSSQKLAVFNKAKNDVISKTLQIAKERGLNVNEDVAGLAFKSTLSADKKSILSELKPSDYPVSEQAQASATYKNMYDNYKILMETATNKYSNVYNSAIEDEESLLIRGALEKLRDANNGGRINASKAYELMEAEQMTREEYNALFNPTNGFYTLFGPGGLYDTAQNWMNQNVMGWNTMTDKNGNKLPAVPDTENIMRYKGQGAAINWDGSWVHNPAEILRQRKIKQNEAKELMNKKSKESVIPRGEKSSLPSRPYSWMKYE